MRSTIRKALSVCVLSMLLFVLPATGFAFSATVTPFVPFEADVYAPSGEPARAVTKAAFANAELTLVNIWATWCPPCIAELPHLGELDARGGGRVRVLGILSDALSADGTPDEEALTAAVTLMTDAEAAYPIVIPDEMLTKVVSLCTSVPTTFLVDREGNVADVLIGSQDLEGWLNTCRQFVPDLVLEAAENAAP